MSLRNPIKYPVKYYSWQDNQAPQLSNTDGVIKTILKACLVTGYSTKQGAGWVSLFEDDYRIVLRRPLRTGNPPDIKIDNGVINGKASHRIVAQDNPTSLDDANELSEVNLLARGTPGNEWHLFATDFAFMLLHTMDGVRSMIYCGEVMKYSDAQNSIFVVNTDNSRQSGYVSGQYDDDAPSNGYLSASVKHFDMITKTNYSQKYFDANFGEMAINQDYFAQKIILGEFIANYPFHTSLARSTADIASKKISLNNRDHLRYVAKGNYYAYNGTRAFYIPLDYWEL